ncbi:MAG TPA: acyl-CoA dehydrogenase family protein [Woeseiaceae bacterium]|nr:acyl-CoA dehydrogenase family protein [Woeseiaceae bacterium]
MDLSLNEMQLMLADSVEKFIANDYDFETRQKYAESRTGFSLPVWQTFAELGWTTVTIGEKDGGFGGGPVDLMVIMERLGRGLVVEPFLSNIVLAAGILGRAGSNEQKSRWLAAITGGELQAGLAFVEPSAGYEINSVQTTATRESGGWVLNGAKAYVLNGGSAEMILVPARTSGQRLERDGITLFAIDASSKGLTIRDYATVDGQRAAEILLDQVNVADDQVIGEVGKGFDSLNSAINDATLAVCAEAVGIMTVLTEKTIEYSKNRVQFGVPISSFQSLQHRMVDMYTACEQSRSLLMWAAMALADDSDEAERAVHSIKYQVGIAGKHIGEEAVQIHGGMGVTWELDVAHYFKRLTAIGIQFGNADWHLDRLAAMPG